MRPKGINNSRRDTRHVVAISAFEAAGTEMKTRTMNQPIDRPQLSAADTVDQLVRAMLVRCVVRRASVLEGDTDARRAQDADAEELRELADLLQGKGDAAARYFVQPWNSPDQMGRWIKAAYKLDCPQEEAVFVFLLNVLCQAYEMVDRDGATPDKPHEGIERLIDMTVCALLNLPWTE